jgi:hypothetical protein
MALQGGITLSQAGDVLRPAVNANHVAATPEEELSQMPDSATNIEDSLAL